MLNFLPDLYEGHAPITLQQLFGDALEAFDTWEDERPEPTVIYQDRLVPISVVFESMRDCTDILPRTMADIIAGKLTDEAAASRLESITFADASRIVGELIGQRRLYGESSIAAFLDHNRADARRPA